jgi:hypothetical protein
MAKPVDEVVRGAQAYSQKAGLGLPDADYSRSLITEPASQAIGNAYSRLPEFDAGALPAYHAMRDETMRQFDHMTTPRSRGGMGIDVEATHQDPYGNGGYHTVVPELRNDVTENHRIKVLSTAATGGHPVFSNDENDAFRAVHDVFGHLGSGRGVDFDGEEAAFQKHSRMFSPLARQAMATETRGQNSALRLHGSFQDQKVGLLPQHMQGLQFSQIGGPAALAAATKRAGAKNREQGLV